MTALLSITTTRPWRVAPILLLVVLLLCAVLAVAADETADQQEHASATNNNDEDTEAGSSFFAADPDDAAVEGQDADDVVSIDTITTDAYRDRRARQKRYGTLPKQVSLSEDEAAIVGDDADAAGENDFGSFASDTRAGGASFTPGAEKPPTPPPTDGDQPSSRKGKGGSSSGGESRKEQYQRKQREYQDDTKQQQDDAASKAASSKDAGTTKSKFPTAPLAKSTTNVAKRAAHVHSELQHYADWLNSQDRRVDALKATVDDDSLAELQLDALNALPLAPIAGHELAHVRTQINAAKKRAAAIRKDIAKALAASSSSPTDDATKGLDSAKKFGMKGDTDRAVALLAQADALVDPIRAAIDAHHEMARALASSAMSSSIVSAGLVKGQLDAVEKALAAIRNQDDSGVGDTERRARRAKVKTIHRQLKSHVDEFANARRLAHAQAAAVRAAFDAHTLKVLAFKNILARQPPAAIAATSEYTVPLPVRLVGFTAHELMMLMLVTLLPYQAFRAVWFVGTTVGAFIKSRKNNRSSAAAAAGGFPAPGGSFPGGPGRVLGSTTAGGAKRGGGGGGLRAFFRRPLVIVAINLVASVALSAGVFVQFPTLTAPAFAYVTPASLWFTWRHVVAPMHQFIVAAGVAWAHVLQVWFTI